MCAAVKRRNRAWGDWPATRMEAPRGGIGFVSSAASCFGSFGPGLKIGFVWYFFGCVAAELGKRARRSRSSRWGAAQRPGSMDWGVGMDEFHFFPVTSVAEIRKDLLETNDLLEEHRETVAGYYSDRRRRGLMPHAIESRSPARLSPVLRLAGSCTKQFPGSDWF